MQVEGHPLYIKNLMLNRRPFCKAIRQLHKPYRLLVRDEMPRLNLITLVVFKRQLRRSTALCPARYIQGFANLRLSTFLADVETGQRMEFCLAASNLEPFLRLVAVREQRLRLCEYKCCATLATPMMRLRRLRWRRMAACKVRSQRESDS